MSNTKIKFNFEDEEQITAGAFVLEKAYRHYEAGCTKKIECIEKAMRGLRNKFRLPGDEAMRDALTDVIRLKDEGKLMECSGDRNMARTLVINNALKALGIQEPEAEEQVQGQICMELPEPKKAEKPLEAEKPEMSEQVKMMRFIAGQVDRVVKALGEVLAAVKES